MRFVQVLRDRYEIVMRARRQNPPLALPKLAGADLLVPRDAFEFFVRIHGEHYNLQLVSRLCETLGVPGETISFEPPEPPPRPESASSFILILLRAAASVRRWPALICDSGLPAREVLGLCARTGLASWPVPMVDPEIPIPDIDPARRARLKGLPAGSEFESTVAALLPDELPWIHLEGRAAHEARVGAAAMAAPRVLLSVDGWHYNEAFKTAAGSFAERGTRLVAVQHGGGYGLYERIWSEDLERAASDSYWCWGWTKPDGDPRLRDVPAPSLSTAPDDGAAGEGLLLVAYGQPPYRYGFQSQAQAGSFGAYLDDRDRFLTELGDLRGRCAVRLPHGNLGCDQSSKLSRSFPEIRIETAAGPLHERLRRSALTIIDHPATSLLEALALDRPTLMFWRPDVWDCRASARPLLDGLRRAGVLFDEPRAAARAAVSAWRDPHAWWSRPEVREAVGAFQKNLALNSPDWRARWAEALQAEVAAARDSR